MVVSEGLNTGGGANLLSLNLSLDVGDLGLHAVDLLIGDLGDGRSLSLLPRLEGEVT